MGFFKHVQMVHLGYRVSNRGRRVTIPAYAALDPIDLCPRTGKRMPSASPLDSEGEATTVGRVLRSACVGWRRLSVESAKGQQSVSSSLVFGFRALRSLFSGNSDNKRNVVSV